MLKVDVSGQGVIDVFSRKLFVGFYYSLFLLNVAVMPATLLLRLRFPAVSFCRRRAQPIPFEHFSREWMNISGQDTFDGFRLEGAKQVCDVCLFEHTPFRIAFINNNFWGLECRSVCRQCFSCPVVVALG